MRVVYEFNRVIGLGMVLNRWKMAIAKQCIFSTEDGRIFAFPLGPYAAYLLPDAKSQSLVENALLWWTVASIPIFVATIAVFKIYSISFDMLMLSVLLHYIIFITYVWFITRTCVRLPIALSIRAGAAVQDQESLWMNSLRITFITILFTPWVFLLPVDPVWYAVTIALLLHALVNWYMVILRRQDRTVSDSFRDKSD